MAAISSKLKVDGERKRKEMKFVMKNNVCTPGTFVISHRTVPS